MSTGPAGEPGTPARRPRRRWAPHPWVLGILGIMALVVGANLAMIGISLHNAPSLVEEDYYERGLTWDRTIEAERRSAATGWKLEMLPQESTGDSLAFRVLDRNGRPLAGLLGAARAYRPSDAALDQLLALAEEPGRPGFYRARYARPARGLWRVTFSLRRDGETFVETLPFVAP